MLIQNSLTRDWLIQWQSSVTASYFMTFLKMLMTSKWNGQKSLFLSSLFEGRFMVCVVWCSGRMLWQCWLRWLTWTCWRETLNATSALRLLRTHRLSWSHTKKYRLKTTGNSKFSLVRLLFLHGSTGEALIAVKGIVPGEFMDVFRYLKRKDCMFSWVFFWESSRFASTVKLIKLKGFHATIQSKMIFACCYKLNAVLFQWICFTFSGKGL